MTDDAFIGELSKPVGMLQGVKIAGGTAGFRKNPTDVA